MSIYWNKIAQNCFELFTNDFPPLTDGWR